MPRQWQNVPSIQIAMASKRVFDPLVILRVAPLLSSTCTLLYAYDQHFFLGMMNEPETRRHSKAMLPAYFTTFFKRGVVFVVSMLAMTTWGSVANLYSDRTTLRSKGSLWWYMGGAAFSTGHLLFIPFVAPSVAAVTQGEGDVNDRLDEWLSVNKLRMVTVDLAAWVALGVAVGRTLSV